MQGGVPRLGYLAILASLALAACSFLEVPGQVDGWSIAEPVNCATQIAKCEQMIGVATERLDERDGNHASIVQVSVHIEGMYPDDDGGMAPVIRSGGPPMVVLFVLADGSRRAIGVKYVLNDKVPTAFDRGPERRPGGGGNDEPPAATF